MRTLNLERHVDHLLDRYQCLHSIKKEIIEAYQLLEECYQEDGKALIAGNGGSSADAGHMVGELMKQFKTSRPLPADFADRLKSVDQVRGSYLAEKLGRGLMAISLSAHEALCTACINDMGGTEIFAQQLLGYGREGDVFIGISTSGNSENIVNAAVVARALGIKVIGLTGADGGDLSRIADISVKVPETETYIVQELHLPIYHCWCLMLEESFFGQDMES